MRTVYVKRSHRKGAKDQAIAIAEALEARQAGRRFPRRNDRPGHASAAVPLDLARSRQFCRQGCPDPAGRGRLRPRGGEVAWWHEPGKDNVLRCSAGEEHCR